MWMTTQLHTSTVLVGREYCTIRTGTVLYVQRTTVSAGNFEWNVILPLFPRVRDGQNIEDCSVPTELKCEIQERKRARHT